jgi:hypothetical protein
MGSTPQHLVDINEAVRITGLARPTLYRLSRQRKIRTFKVLSALRFEVHDLEALVSERAAHVPSGPEAAQGAPLESAPLD